METRVIESEILNQIIQSQKYQSLNDSEKLCCAVSGLCEEAGEVAGLLNREVYKKKDVPLNFWLDELGDALWYVTAIAALKGFTLEDVFNHNTSKLKQRYGETYGDRENRNPST